MVNRLKSGLAKCKNSFILKSFFVLGLSGVLCKLIGVFYRVPLTNILGSEGIGIYQLIFPIYSLLLVVSSSALPVALSKMIAEKLNKGQYYYIEQLKKVAFKSMLFLGIVLSVLVACFSNVLAIGQGSSDAGLGFLLISPSILIVALICVYRGIFQGFNNVTPTANSQLIEQSVKLVLGLVLAVYLMPFGVMYAVGGAIFAVTISELIALIYLMIKYKNQFGKSVKQIANLHSVKKSKKDINQIYNNDSIQIKRNNDLCQIKGENCKNQINNTIQINNINHIGGGVSQSDLNQCGCNLSQKAILKELIATILPITLSGVIIPASLVIDSFLIINLLVASNVELGVALSSYGLLSGVVSTLINVPIVIVSSLGVVAVPLIAKINIKNSFMQLKNDELKQINNYVTKFLNLTFLVAVPCVLVFAIFSAQILHLLYPSLSGGELAKVSKLLVISSSTVLSLAVFYISTSILQGFGKSYFPCMNAVICSILRILSYMVLISFYDIYAVAISSCVWYLVMAVVNIHHMLKFTCIDLIDLIKILLSSIIFIVITFCIFACLVSALGSIAFVVGAVFGGFVYLLLNIKLLLNE